jgi:hypothetical protein
LEKVGLFWKKPYFFFKRLKLDNLKKSRAFSKKALLFPEKALLFRLKLRTLETSLTDIVTTNSVCFLYIIIVGSTHFVTKPIISQKVLKKYITVVHCAIVILLYLPCGLAYRPASTIGICIMVFWQHQI